MQFDFISMQNIYLSLAREDARPLARALSRRPATARESQWATFVRNHDELTLDKLTDRQREEVFAAFGPDRDMQLYDRGLRRRLPTMLDGDPRRLRMVYSLLFSLPGTPVLFYGEEIGMGENLDVEGRLAVRTPMQWTSGRNGGFSDAAPSRLPRPVVDGAFGPEHVNVADQRHDPDSLLAFLTLLIRRYRESPELGWSDVRMLDQPLHQVLAHECVKDDRRLVVGAQPGGGGVLGAPHARRLPARDHAGRPAQGRAAHRGLRPWRCRGHPRGLRLPMAAGGRARQPSDDLRAPHPAVR